MTDRMETVLRSGHVAVITGAAKGIGEALARALAARGTRLASFDRDGPALEAPAASLVTEVLVMAGDVTKRSDIERLRDLVEDRFGAVHLLVNNAGIMQKADPWDDPAPPRAVAVAFGLEGTFLGMDQVVNLTERSR